jgi:hypothetical protein
MDVATDGKKTQGSSCYGVHYTTYVLGTWHASRRRKKQQQQQQQLQQ